MRTILAAVAFVVAAFIIFYNSHFSIEDNQQVVITRSGVDLRSERSEVGPE